MSNKVNNNSKNKKTIENNSHDDFEVLFSSEVPEDNTVIITSAEKGKQWLESAMSNYDPANKIYSAYLNDNLSCGILDADLIDKLSINPQSNLCDILTINSIIRKQINADVMIGKTYETIESNVNTRFKISYNDFSNNRNKNKTLEKAKSIINDFNMKINIEQFLRDFLPTMYAEGTYCTYLRKDNNNYVADYYPLGVAIVSDFERNKEPYILIDVTELTSRLRKNILKDKKGKALFFENIDEEIKNNYPPEVYLAYQNKDRYAKLNIQYSGIGRTGNLHRKYGLSPLFRALKPTIILDTFENTDKINSKAKAKKIIFQQLRKEVMGEKYDKDGFEQMAYSHKNLMLAWQQSTVVVTAPAYVEDIKYVEPDVENTSSETMDYYTKQKALALGISFLSVDNGQTVTTANISISELIKTINKIMEQAANILNKWYRVILLENGIGTEYAPTITITSSEEMEFETRKALAEFMFTKLACSYESSMGVLGIDIDDELQKRTSENAAGYSKIFEPHPISFTTSKNSDNQGGNPRESTDPQKEDYDKVRNNS